MNLTRRDFLRWASLSAVGAVACNIFSDRELSIQSPAELPEDLVKGEDNWYATLCGQCPEHEGIIVRVFQGRAKKIQGNLLYPTNKGKQSPRCEGGLQALYHPDRIDRPLVRVPGPRSGQFAATTWADAMNRLNIELGNRRGGANALLTITEPLRGNLGGIVRQFSETYGGRHMMFEPLDNLVLRRAVKESFGQDVLPRFDIENTRFLLSFGADFLSTWVSPTQYAREYGNFRHSEGRGRGYLVHADPRFSMTAASADEWIPIRPGAEGVLALSIACVITENADQWGVPAAMVDAMTQGEGPDLLNQFSPERVAGSEGDLAVGIPERLRGETPSEVVRRIAQRFATERPSLAIGGGEAGAHPHGLSNLNAVLSLNYLVDGINKDGGVIFNPSPPLSDLKPEPVSSLDEWRESVGRINSGEVKVVLVRGANPVHGLPSDIGFWNSIRDANDLYVVSFSSFLDETSEMADLVLPDRTPLEDWGNDVPEPGPGHQVVGVRQPVVNPLPGLDPRGFGDVLLAVAQDQGFEQALPYNNFQEVLREGAQKLYDLNRGSLGDVPRDQVGSFDEFWRTFLQKGFWHDPESGSRAGTPRPPDLAPLAQSLQNQGLRPDSQDNIYSLIPFASNSLLEGQGAHIPWLQATPDPITTVAWQTWVEISLADAKEKNIKLGDLIRLTLAEGTDAREIVAVAYPHPAIPPGVVAVPMGQGHTSDLKYSGNRGANVLSFLPIKTVANTGALAWAANRVRLERLGPSARVTKFENSASSTQEYPHRIVQVSNK